MSGLVKPQSIYLLEMWIDGEYLMVSGKRYTRDYKIGERYCDPSAPERCRHFTGCFPYIPCNFQVWQFFQALFYEVRFSGRFHAL